MYDRRPLPFGRPTFQEPAPDHALAPAPRPPKSFESRTGALLAIVGAAALGFALAWTLFSMLGNRGGDASVLYDERLVSGIFKGAAPAVVEIRTVVQSGRRIGHGSGSGFLIDDRGHIVTNSHVVEGASEVTVHLSDGRTLTATRLGNSVHDDLAALRVDPEQVSDIRPLEFADSDLVEPGQMAIAIGSPFERFNSMSVGVVSGVERSSDGLARSGRAMTGMIQTDAALNPGNSGGPLLNAQGKVIGVNSSVRIESGMQIGVGFAVASNTVTQILDELRQPGEFKRPWMGFYGRAVEDLNSYVDLPAESGVYVINVCDGGPADHAGIQDDYLSVRFIYRISGRGDIITGVDGQTVRTLPDLLSYVNNLDVGDSITLSILRNGNPTTAEVTLGEWEDGCN